MCAVCRKKEKKNGSELIRFSQAVIVVLYSLETAIFLKLSTVLL